MEPPLTRLDWHWWAIFADWCQEYRPKGEAFARKVAKSLRKMEAVGCDPKMPLLGVWGGIPYIGLHPNSRWRYDHHRQRWEIYCGSFAVVSSELQWDTTRNKLYVDKRGYPADLPKPLQDTRLAWKFWKCVNRRALGIKDSVLEG